MSLTRELKSRTSPVAQFFPAHFPNLLPVRRDWSTAVAGAMTIHPEPPPPPTRPPYETIGVALDYRIRYSFAVTPPEKLAAARGAATISRGGLLLPGGAYVRPPSAHGAPPKESKPAGELATAFFGSLQVTLDELKPAGRRLEPAEEERLGRHCYVLALYEELFRAGLALKTPLYRLQPEATLSDLLALADQPWIADLRELSWAFYEVCGPLLAQPAILNPTFSGTRDIHGADADLILNRCLIEIKTTVRPRLERSWLYQLLGYVLLDYEDAYGIEAVGIYLARQSRLVRLPLTELLWTLTGRQDLTLVELRDCFRRVVTTRKQAADQPNSEPCSCVAEMHAESARAGMSTDGAKHPLRRPART